MSKYTTGEMAKLRGVSVRTVQYYDTRGILTPSELSEGGRRLYSEDDLKRMKVICFLRDAGLSINGIGELLSETDPGNVLSVLLEQQEQTLSGEIEERQEKLELLGGIRRALKSVSLAENGLIVANVQVDAMTSWGQFFKNIPIALIAFVLIFSDSFTKEYSSGTLLLALTKGLARYKVVLAKTVLLFSLWTLGYGLCFSITYGYTTYFWDNSIANHLLFAAAMWWLFGMWVISLIVLFSSLLQNNTGVTLCTGGIAVFAYLLSVIPKAKTYSPALLMNVNSLLTGVEGTKAYRGAALVAVVSAVIFFALSVLNMNKRKV